VNLSGFHNLYPAVYNYRSYDIEDTEDANIGSILEDAVDFIRTEISRPPTFPSP
jgi:hypothetical protein